MKKEPKGLYARDSDGLIVRAGHRVSFCYGIPPLRVDAKVIELDGKLWALTPGHTPDRCTLADLREWCEHFWRI